MVAPARIVFNVHQAKTHLSELLARAERGEDVVIARDGVAAVRLVPVHEVGSPRTPGTARGMIELRDDFDAPMPPEFLAAFQ
jgi:prevent-host-death family protein